MELFAKLSGFSFRGVDIATAFELERGMESDDVIDGGGV